MLQFLYHNLPFRLPIQCSLLYSEAVVRCCSAKRLSYKFRKIHKKTPKKRFRHRFFPANSAKFLIISFLKDPSESSFCLLSLHHLSPFKKNVIHIFWLSIFRLNLKAGNQSELNISSPQPETYLKPSRTSAMESFLREQLTV